MSGRATTVRAAAALLLLLAACEGPLPRSVPPPVRLVARPAHSPGTLLPPPPPVCASGECGALDLWVTRGGPVRVPLTALAADAAAALPALRVRLGAEKIPVQVAAGDATDPVVLVYVPDVRPDGYSRESHLFADLAPDDPSPRMAARPDPGPVYPAVSRILQRRVIELRDTWASGAPPASADAFADLWVGPRTHVGESAAVSFGGLAPTARARALELSLLGGAVFAHHVEVAAGGVALAALDFTGVGTEAATRPLPDVAPAAGALAVSLTLRSTEIADVVHLRAATLLIEDELTPSGAPLDLPCLEAAPVDVVLAGAPGGLTAWDVTTPAAPQEVLLRAAGAQVVLPGFAPGHRYVLFDPARVPFPDDQVPLAAPARVRDEAGTLLVVAAPLFHEALGPWLEQVTVEGWTPIVRTPRELYQTFTAGRPTPDAIAAYLAHAQAQWPVPPRALLLVGDATPALDGGAPPFHVPATYLYYPGYLWVASDLVYALPGWGGAGDPGPARVAVGRIPARTAAQAQAALGRSLLHRATQNRAVLFLSDDNEPNFRAAAETARAALPAGLDTQALHLLDYDAQYPTPDPAPPQWEEPAVIALRADLRAALASGVRLVQYFGHGDLNHVAGEGILDQGSELDNLSAMLGHGGLPPIFVLHDCLSGSFGMPSLPHAIGESMMLLTDPTLGAAAVISPAGLTIEPLTTELALAFEAALTAAAQPTLGAALAAAVRARLADSGCFTPECRVTAVTTSLLGDPTLPSLAAVAGSAP